MLLGGKAVDAEFCAYPALQEHWTSDGAASVQVASAWQGSRVKFPQIFETAQKTAIFHQLSIFTPLLTQYVRNQVSNNET